MPAVWLSLSQNSPDILKQFDQLVVGGGLAGSLMAYRLWKAGQKVCWIKTSPLGSSTDVAAGLINPLVFRYLTPVWKVETLLPQAFSFYRQLEVECGWQFLHEITVAKLFGDQDQALWQRKLKLPKVSRWVESIGAVADDPQLIQPWGAGFVNGYRLDTSTFLMAVEQLLNQHLNLIEGYFDPFKLEYSEEGILYENSITAKKLIFCEGWNAVNNSFFNFIPFRPVKGELLTLKIKDWKSDYLLNKDVFLLPIGDQFYSLGATYDWDDLTDTPSEAAKTDLLEKLKAFLPLEVEVVEHRAGVRPAVADRRPVAGWHPEFPHLAILNGLGARGLLIAPWLSQQLLELILNDKEIDAEVDPLRFWKK